MAGIVDTLKILFASSPATSDVAATGIGNAVIAEIAGGNPGTIPIKGIIFAYLTAQNIIDYFDATGLGDAGSFIGWAICNGSNGTPDGRGKFFRLPDAWTTGAGATGGNDAVAHTHTGGSLCADIDFFTNAIKYNYAAHNSTAKYKFNPTQSGSDDTSALTAGVVVSGTTSGASNTENRPAYVELVALMRVT